MGDQNNHVRNECVQCLQEDVEMHLEQIKALTAERDKLKAAATLAAEQIRKCDYTPARSTLLEALKESV